MPRFPLRRGRRWAAWLGVALLLPALWHMPWAEMLRVLAGLSPLGLVGLAVLNAAFVLLSAARWWVLVRAVAIRPVACSRLVAYRLVGFAISYFTPGTQVGGEPWQVWALHRREGVPPAAAAASVALDRMLDFTANTGFLLGALVWVGLRLSAVLPTPGAWGLAAGLAVLVALGWVVLCRSPWSPETAGWRGWLGQAAHLCRRHPRAVARAAGLSVLLWGVLLAEYHWMLHALGLRPAWGQTVAMMLAARLAFLTPMPAGAGALEAGQAWAAQWLGWPLEFGLALGVLIRIRDVSIGGLGLLLGHHLWPGSASSAALDSTSGGVS